MGGWLVTAFFVVLGAIVLLSRRSRRSDQLPPRWLVLVEMALFLVWAGRSLFAGAQHPTSPTGIFLLVFGTVVALLTATAPWIRGGDRPRQGHESIGVFRYRSGARVYIR